MEAAKTPVTHHHDIIAGSSQRQRSVNHCVDTLKDLLSWCSTDGTAQLPAHLYRLKPQGVVCRPSRRGELLSMLAHTHSIGSGLNQSDQLSCHRLRSQR